MNDQTKIRPDTTIPLPATAEDWLEHRKIKHKRTLNDLVEEAHIALLKDEEEEYEQFLDAVWDEEAVEGSLAADNLEAAALIREWAVKRSILEITSKKKATIAKSLGIVLRRYGLSRKERRNTVGGKIVPTDSNSNE